MKLLIKNGHVIDPMNGISSKLNIVCEDGKIIDVTRNEPKCERVIDAKDKCVVPGFIDIHMHEEQIDETRGELKKTITMAMLRMGVTSLFGGNCGINTIDPLEYMRIVEEKGAPTNIGFFVGHTFFRNRAGMTDKYSTIDDEKLDVLKALIKDRLDVGCFGVSFGIRYVPGINEKELLAIAELCLPENKIISAHVRADAEYIFDSMNELIDAGKKLNLPVQVSHIGSMGGFGQMEKMLEMIDECKANNYDVTADCYPYYAFSTRIGETTYDEGFLERYKCDYSVVEISEGKYKGQRCTEKIFNELRTEAPETLTVCHVMKKEDVDMALLHPNVMLASDGLMDNGQGHPRAAGTFPRFINKYVQTGKISLYDAIDKMTAKQAEKLKLKNKGRLNVGADADIVVFDLEKIKDNATFEHPIQEPSGIDYVIISGEIAVENNKILNDSLGKVIRKK